MIINLPDNWTLIKMIVPYQHKFWAVEHTHHQIMEGVCYTDSIRMNWVKSGTYCDKCGEGTPKELEGVIKLLEWEQ